MTELAVRDETAVDVMPQRRSPGGALAEMAAWADTARAAHTMAQSLVKTSFVPEAFRDKPHEAAAAIMAGVEVGLSPMAALRSFDIIQGVAAARAMTLRAIVQAAGHEIWVEESTATRAIVKGRRKGESAVVQSVWTIDRAKQLGLTGKHNWRVQPTAMLLARATAECCRLVASDAILGLGYAAEEIDGYGEDNVIGNGKPKRRPKTKPAEPMPEPELIPEPVDDDPKPAQLAKMFALFRQLEVSDTVEQHRYAAHVLGVDEVVSFAGLTTDQLGTVLEALERWAEQSEPEGVPDEA